MKKLLIALLALTVVGVAAFAQDTPSLKFSGSLQTGVQSLFGDSQDPAIVYNYADDAEKDLFRLRLAGEYVNGDAGLKFRVSASGAGAVGTDYAYTWFNLMDGMVHVKGGYGIDDDSWRTKGDAEFDYEGSGVKVELKPIEGLNIGAMMVAPASKATGVEAADATYIAGFNYGVDMFSVQAGLKMDMGELKAVYGGAEYTGISGLVLDLEGQATVIGGDGLGDFSDFGRATIVQSVEYTMGAIEAGIYAYEWVYGDSDIDLGIKINPYVAYNMGMTTLKLEATYNTDEYEIVMEDGRVPDLAEDEFSTFSIMPSVKFVFAPAMSLIGAYEYVAMTDMAFDDTQRVFINFIYEF